eukprot:947216-Alexandrium_andersonii.AAC.1
MHAAMCEIISRSPPCLQSLKQGGCPDWADTMAERIRHLCSRARKGLQRANQAGWANDLKQELGVAPRRGVHVLCVFRNIHVGAG